MKTGDSDGRLRVTQHPPEDVRELLRHAEGRWELDPAQSRVQFHVDHFWGLVTVHGHFEQIEGEGTVAADGSVSGQLRMAASSINTKNAKRDKHLRSADFFDSENHPAVVVTVEELRATNEGALRCRAQLEAAGQRLTIEPTVEVADVAQGAVTLRAEVVVDRTRFGMTWSPLGMASSGARAAAGLRFVRQSSAGRP
jgi:polyisoprenoid-binding protein YceI